MNLAEYKFTLTSPLKPRTVTFLTRNSEVLLGYKKTGFGQGYYIGIGGKVEENETIEEAAGRELSEEISIMPSELIPMGTVNFYFPKESWNQEVHIFTSDRWKGEPKESDEVRPEWFKSESLPLDRMWDDAKYWIPRILKGEEVRADFLFNDELNVIDSSIPFNM
jgi:8-oxo-dGTP diphosphatase